MRWIRSALPQALPLIVVLLANPLAAPGAAREPVGLQIPMRDGAELAGDLYTPDPDKALPTVLIQTPYNKDRLGQVFAQDPPPNPLFASEAYAFVILDWRGRFASEGAGPMRPRGLGQDGYDAVEWVASQEWCSGKVGTWGPSALGHVQYATARQQPPHLACCVPMVATAVYRFETFYPGGALRQEYVNTLDVLGFGMKRSITGSASKNWVWRLLELSWRPQQIHVPMLLIGGWYDIHAQEVPDDFNSLRQDGYEPVRAEHGLLMGPWCHSFIDRVQQGELRYPRAQHGAGREALAFFDHWLRGSGSWDEREPVRYFQMGENEWCEVSTWPPAGTVSHALYLDEGGRLVQGAPKAGGADSYAYDPADPTPTVGGALILARGGNCGPKDQRGRVETRPDVVVYTSDELEEGLRVAGTVAADLFVSSDRTDTDFAVRLCDVYPDGRSMLVADGIVRMTHRESLTYPTLIEPGQVYRVRISLPPTAITFRAGHRVRISVNSANYPRFSVNTNGAGGDELLTARNRVYLGGDRPSRLLLPVLHGSN